jgi:hypothetical protein
MRPKRPFNLDCKAFCPRRPFQVATQLTLVVWDGGYLRLEGRNIKARAALMLFRQNAYADFAGRDSLVNPFLARDLSLTGFFFFLLDLGPFQFLEG